MKQQPAHKSIQSGLTLVETIIIISLFAILSLAVAESIASFYSVNAYTIAQSYQVNHARQGIESLVRDLREMTLGDDGTFPLAIMDPNEVGFYSDIDKDNSVEYVEYEVSTTTLEKRIYNATGSPPVYNFGVPDQTIILSEYVQNILQGTSTFLYYDQNGLLATPTSTVTDIKYIGVKLIVNIDPVRDPGEFTLRSSAALRNLKESQ